jgi:4-hydroxybenzoate polyprenyltransferase
MLADLLRLARPADWIKNVFVLIPVPFALADEAQREAAFHPGLFLLGLFGFCLANSAVYTLNDLLDVEADRLHPRKRHRPVAAGRVSVAAALFQGAVLLLVGLGLCLATGRTAAVWLALLYVEVNLVYSLWAKRVALLDVFLLSSGYVIRVLLGCALVVAAPSAWLLLCSSSLALFLGFTKRRADLMAGLDSGHRPSLRGYSKAFLDQAITICAGVALLAYALYSINSDVFKVGREMASMPLVAYGILNYLRLANTENAGASPVEIAYHSRSSQLCAIGWMIAVTWSLGMW